jgi:FAD/FMN-containing dehydrogenase
LIPFYLPSFVLNTFTVKILNSILYWKQKNSSGLSHYDTFFYPLDMINNWNRGYGKRGFIQYQFVLPEKNGKENIRRIMESITMRGCNPFLNVLKKFGSNKSGPLSFPMPGYTFAIDFPITKRLKNFTRKLDMMVLEAGGRLYLGKDAYLDADTFRQMYPEFEAFSNLKSKYDPDNIWQSDISRRLKIN